MIIFSLNIEVMAGKAINVEVLRIMEQYKQEFIEFMVDSDVLKFGEFTLKSGRKSPFFYECGRLCDRISAEEAGRVLRESDPRQVRG